MVSRIHLGYTRRKESIEERERKGGEVERSGQVGVLPSSTGQAAAAAGESARASQP